MPSTLVRLALAVNAVVALMATAPAAQAAVESHDLGLVQVSFDRAYLAPGGFHSGHLAYSGREATGTATTGWDFDGEAYRISAGTDNLLRIDFVPSGYEVWSADATNFDDSLGAGFGVGELRARLPLAFVAEAGHEITGYKLTLGVESGSRDRWHPEQAFDASFRIGGGFTVGSGDAAVDLLNFDRSFTGRSDPVSEALTATLSGDADLSTLAGHFAGSVLRPGTWDGEDHRYESFLTLQYMTIEAITAPVPEPETWASMVAGLAALAALRRRRSLAARA